MTKGKAKKYTSDMPRKLYSFFIGYSESVGAPSFSKFARSIGVTCSDLQAFRKHAEFERAYVECNEIRRDYLIDNALSKRFDGSLTKMLTLASYLMYFSLEDAGEKLGEESEEYKEALLRYEEERGKIKGEDMDGLRKFCLEYSEEELKYRQKANVTSHALSPLDYERFLNGEKFDKRTTRIFRRVRRLRAIPLTPKALLTKERESTRSELVNPKNSSFYILS